MVYLGAGGYQCSLAEEPIACRRVPTPGLVCNRNLALQAEVYRVRAPFLRRGNDPRWDGFSVTGCPAHSGFGWRELRKHSKQRLNQQNWHDSSLCHG